MSEFNEAVPGGQGPGSNESLPVERREPPLVLRPGDSSDEFFPPPSSPNSVKRARKTGPGLFESILWCVVFLLTQVVALLAVLCLVLAIYAAQAPDARQFLDDQLKGFSEAAGKTGDNRAEMPFAIGEAMAWGMLAAQGASVVLILLVLPWRIGRDWRRQISFRRPALIHVLLVCLLVPGVMVASSGIEMLLKQATGYSVPSTDQVIHSTFRSFPWFLTFLAAAFGPGLVEETWCRGFIGRGLSARYGLAIGVILTSILFGLLHCDLMYAAVVACMGVALHLSYLAARSIWISILLHTLNNGIAVALLLGSFADPTGAAPPGVTIGIYAAAVVLLISGGIAFWTCRSRLVSIDGANGEEQLWKPEYPGISSPPPGMGLALRAGKVNLPALAVSIGSFAILIWLTMF